VAVPEDFRRVSSADDARNAKLTRYDGRMRSPPTLVGNYSRNSTHDRFPIRIRKPGHEYVTGFDRLKFVGFTYNPHASGANLLTDRLPGYKWWSMFASQPVN